MRPVYEELRRSAGRVGLLARASLLVLSCSLSAAKGTFRDDLPWLGLLIPIAVLGSNPERGRIATLLIVSLESIACAAAVLGTGAESSVFLPYLIAPAFSGALMLGLTGALVPPGAAALTLLLGRIVRDDLSPLHSFGAAVALWVVLSSFVGVVTAWVSHVAAAARTEPQGSQKVANELLARLRTVARRLPGTLDPSSTAESLLRAARDIAPYSEGAVFVRSAGSRLLHLARSGTDHPAWDVSLSADGALADAWATQESQIVNDRRLPRTSGPSPPGSSLVIPLTLGLRTLGLLVLESDRPRTWTPEVARAIKAVAGDLALQLESGLLFDEVRALATTEERSRMAREIHDGIAQELVFLGYSLDNLMVEAEDHDADLTPALRELRAEVTRLISELRLSLFDLRANSGTTAGLGTVLSDYVRSVGTQAGLTVHLSLSESAARLSPAVEVELLRITQEAVANVRKHARARNLWLSCTIEPPAAVIRVEDDGVGMERGSAAGSYGLAIMAERADRLNAQLHVRPRGAGGTVVEVGLGTVADPSLQHGKIKHQPAGP